MRWPSMPPWSNPFTRPTPMATSAPSADRAALSGLTSESNCALECEQMSLTREAWEALSRVVYERDLRTGYELSRSTVSFVAWMAMTPHGACVAWQLDPRLWGTCSGRLTLDHIHSRGQTALQMKATDDERHLQTVCEWHHGTNRIGGGWITSADAREAARVRLEGLYPG